jgi:cell division initiation protein
MRVVRFGLKEGARGADPLPDGCRSIRRNRPAMRMTALDVQNHKFPRRFKGYDVDEVEHFRSALVEDWAALTAEAESLRRRVKELERQLEKVNTHEDTLRNALVTAQGVTDELRRTAEHEAQMRVGQAELQAEKILAAAHRQATRLAQDVRELRGLRSQLAGSVRATIETHLALLEGFSQDPDDEADAAIEARLSALAGPPPAAEPTAGHAEPEPLQTVEDDGPETGPRTEPWQAEPWAAPQEPQPEGAPRQAWATPESRDEARDASASSREPRLRKLDSYVIPSGKPKAASAAPSDEDERSGRTWTILPGQG